MKRTTRALGCLVVLAMVATWVGCPPVRPLTIRFNQGTYDDLAGYSELNPSTFFGGTQQLGDDFTLAPGTATITYVRWWGGYRDNSSPMDDFTIRIFEEGCGLPEMTPLHEVHAGAAGRYPTGDVISPGVWDAAIYEYSTNVPAITLDPSTTYFISIVNDTGRWLWCNNGSASEGNDYGVSRDTVDGAWGSHGIDMAFQLWSNQ